MQGIYNILVTPFTDSGEVDIDSLKSLVDFQLSAGVSGLTVAAILGEGSKLTDDEWHLVVKTVIEHVDGRKPVVVTVTHPSTRIVIERTQMAANLGGAAVMAAPPVLLRNLDAVGEFFRQLGNASIVPVVVQDEPATTNVILPSSFLASTGHTYIKLEEYPVLQKISSILKINPDIKIFGGLGGQYFLEELGRGAVGTMTGFAATEVLVRIYDDFVTGKIDQAQDTFFKHIPLIRFEYQVGVGLSIRKEILRRRGIIKTAEIRSPGMRMDQQSHAELTRILDYVGVPMTI